MNDKLKKLQELADIIDAREDNNEVFLLLAKIKDIETKLETLGNFATKQEAEDIYNALANAFNELKTGDKTGELESKINLITNDYKKLLKSADYSTDYFKKEIQTIKNVVADLKAVKAQVIDTEKIIQDTSKLVKDELIKLIPKEKELPQVPTLQEIISNIPTEPDKIRDALELLQGEERLDASAIKGLQELIKGLKQEKATIIGANKPLSGLLDVDVAGIAVNQSIRWDGIKWVAFTPSAGVTSFTGLTDTPSSYTGQGGKIVKVKGTEDGLEFDVATDTDEKVKYDASDPTAGYIADKFVAGTGITVAEGTGGNENKLVITNSQDLSGYFNKTTDTTDNITDTSTNRFTNDTDITRLAGTSGNNTGDQDLSGYIPYEDTTLTADRILATNGDKDVVALDTTTYPSLTELSYVKGVTSAIQTQLNNKLEASALTPYAKLDGTNQPFTGDIEVYKTTPESRLTDDTEDEYTRIIKNGSNDDYEAVRYNRSEVIFGGTYSAKFSGINRLTAADNDNFTFSAGTAFTIMFRFKKASVTGFHPMIAKVGGQYEYEVAISSGKIYLGLYTSGGGGAAGLSSPANSIQDDTWHSVAVTRTTGTAVEIFIDGVSVASGTNTTAMSNTAATFNIGYRGDGNYQTFDGLIADVKVYRRQLVSPEIYDWSVSETEPSTTSLVGRWSLNNSLLDTSGNSYTLTNTGSVTFDADYFTDTTGVQEYQIWHSKKAGSNFTGKNTWGNTQSDTYVQGKRVSFEIGSAVKATIDTDTTLNQYSLMFSDGVRLNSNTSVRTNALGYLGVGIDPVSPFHAYGTSNDLVLIEGTTANGYTQLALKGTGRRYQIGVGNASETGLAVANKLYVYDATGGGVRAVMDTSGNWGYGITSPTARAHFVATSAATVGVKIQGAASQSANILQIQNSAGTIISNFRLTAGAGTITTNFLNVTGTLSTASSSYSAGVRFDITGAGTSTNSNIGTQLILRAGYTGSGISAAYYSSQLSAGTGNDLSLTSTIDVDPAGNVGSVFKAIGTTTGANIGGYYEVANGILNIGVVSKSTAVKNSATNIGVLGIALNTGTTPIQVGGFFGLMNTTPTFTSAALMADNGSTTSDIFVARDNGTDVFSVSDGGTVNTQNIYPITDDTYYLGKNDDDTPKAWKGLILKDTTDGKYYRYESVNGVLTAVDLTD
jgi:hypothetical protein